MWIWTNTRAFDIIDVMYQSLRTVLNVKSTYQTVSDRISDYKNLLEDFNDKVIKRKHIELADTMLISINKKAIDNIYNEGTNSTIASTTSCCMPQERQPVQLPTC